MTFNGAKRTIISAIAVVGLLTVSIVTAQKIGLVATARARLDRPRATDSGVLLHDGWVLHPAGRQIPIGDLPVAMALSPDGGHLLVSTAGYAPCQVISIDTANEQKMSTQTLDQTWEGMTFNSAGSQLFVSGGGRALIWRFDYNAQGGDLIRREPLPVADLAGRDAPYVTPKRPAAGNPWIGGLTVSARSGALYALNTSAGTLYALDPLTGKATHQARTGDHPVAVAVAPDQQRVYVVNQGGESVSVFNAANLENTGTIAVGKQPVALLFTMDGKRLFVANSGSNTVSVIDPASNTVRETIRTSLFPNSPTGSTPNALALSPDASRLFITNADNNDVAVVDVSNPAESRVLGFIPTGWYPTAVAVSRDGKKLFVAVGKGLVSRPNHPRSGGGVGLNIYHRPAESYGPGHDQTVTFDYICSLMAGAVSVIDMPDAPALAKYTAQVIDGCPYRDEYLKQTADRPAHTVVPGKVGEKSPIRHIVYIIKENRTYDQIFGDIKEGDGDPNLVLFGETVTPNHHALARQFVLLDNLYCNGEVSEDGHQWSNAAFCTDWTQKVYPGNYATPSRGDAPGNAAVSASPGGYLWDNCAEHGMTYRTYGEFTSFRSDADSQPVATSVSKNLNGHISVAWELAARQGKRRDYLRADAFIEELHAAEKSGDWPNYMVMSLGEDHTVGLSAGQPTPWAAVASNDLALGKIVDAVSHSKFWGTTAIFVIEDDAQAGPDHVDAHRTVGLVISPYIRRRSVDHTFYTTSSFLRTMELLLGLPPMTQYDAGATPVMKPFSDRPDLTAYTVIPAKTDIAALNPKRTPAARASARLNFNDYDKVDPDTLNRMLWKSLRCSPYPGTSVGPRIAAQ